MSKNLAASVLGRLKNISKELIIFSVVLLIQI